MRSFHGSLAYLQKPQVELDGKACATIGQNGLMALYDTQFSQMDVTSAQLLVTDNDFRSPEFRQQLTETVDSLLMNKVIPIFNENDVVSTRQAPYEDSSGIFWDNDSLAALLALELKADLINKNSENRMTKTRIEEFQAATDEERREDEE